MSPTQPLPATVLIVYEESKAAASVPKKAHAKRLALTHFSARYRNASTLVKQAREVFPETFAAKDGMFFEVPAKSQ